MEYQHEFIVGTRDKYLQPRGEVLRMSLTYEEAVKVWFRRKLAANEYAPTPDDVDWTQPVDLRIDADPGYGMEGGDDSFESARARIAVHYSSSWAKGRPYDAQFEVADVLNDDVDLGELIKEIIAAGYEEEDES